MRERDSRHVDPESAGKRPLSAEMLTVRHMGRPSAIGKRELARREQRLRTVLGSQILELRHDAGLSQLALAQAAGIGQGHISRIESGRTTPSLETVIAIATCLGSDLSLRLFPGSTPRIRDHIQAPMIGALVRLLSKRWISNPELPVPAARGVIDLALRLRTGELSMACEAHSQLRSIDLVQRRLHEKTLALGQLDGYPSRASSLLLIRSTRANQDVVRLHAATLAASFPGACREAIAGLTGADAEWPGPTILWARVERGRAEILDRPPRGVAVGR